MKESFKAAMQLLYPLGIDNQHQLRDLIRTYTMGFADALMSLGVDNKAALIMLAEVYNENVKQSDINWWPDDTWKWWGVTTCKTN